jgi:hypothetical protein
MAKQGTSVATSAEIEQRLEEAARFACEWSGADPDSSLGGDRQNYLWMEAVETLVKPLLAKLGIDS